MLTPPTPSHLLWSLLCRLLLQLLMSSMRASQLMRLLCWQGSFVPCTSSIERGGDHPRVVSSVETPLTSSPIAPRGKGLTPPTSTTMPTRMTPATRATTRRRTASETRRRRISSKRSCPERVLPEATWTSQVKTPLAQKRMRTSSARKATSPNYALWANLH
jgi:hypothetical protein